jgi:L-ascorbate metabolism protein UlaG (beta-lactamase superfamily)
MASVQLVRHATLLLRTGGVTFLVDPMLDEPGAREPIPNTPNEQRNPLVELPDVELDADAVVVTHTHADHFDEAAGDALDHGLAVFCQPEDLDTITEQGFADVRPVGSATTFEGVGLTRTGGRHGHGPVADDLGPVSGFVFEAADEPTVFVAGDTVWCDVLADALDAHSPDAVVLNAGGARFVGSEPITMTAEDVRTVRAAVPDATLIAVHMEAINHCLLDRASLAAAVPDVAVPADGESVELG